jgi:tRNA 2-thiouridine synthesizing protein A
MAHYELDASGLLCPMPVIRTQDRVEDLSTGDTLEVLCTDPGALNDVSAWCRINGHKLIDARQEEDRVIIKLQVLR